MRVLVTGASGYIGRAVVRQLLSAGYPPRLLVHSARPTVPAGAEAVVGDLMDRPSLVRAVAGVDAVVHLAAMAGVRHSFDQAARFHELNVGGTLNVLAALAAAAGPAPRLVFASTAGVYGVPERQPIGEDAVPAPTSPYASSKLAAEEAVVEAVGAGRLGASTLRIFNAAGAVDGHGDPDDSRIIARATAVAAGRLPTVQVYGDGSAIRDFVHVKDIARAFVAALEHCAPGRHEVFNVGATTASVSGVIATVRRVSGRDVAVVHQPANPREVPEVRADTARLRRVLGWRAEHSTLAEMVADQWAAECARSRVDAG